MSKKSTYTCDICKKEVDNNDYDKDKWCSAYVVGNLNSARNKFSTVDRPLEDVCVDCIVRIRMAIDKEIELLEKGDE